MAAKKLPATMREVRAWANDQSGDYTQDGEFGFHGVQGIIPAKVVAGFEKATRRKVGAPVAKLSE